MLQTGHKPDEASKGRLVDAGTDEDAFRDLYDRHHRRVLAYLLRRANREAAFDAAEDVFLVAWRRLSEIPPDDRALPWLYGVARRVLANQRRSASRFARLARRAAASVPDPPPGPEAEAITSLETDAVLTALATLPDPDQEVLRLTYWEELPHAEIAPIIGCSTESVHVRRYRAERRLANALARAGHKPSGRPAVLPEAKEEG
jgi:RNA polymerase sigma-70 factor (ECF subfamily)